MGLDKLKDVYNPMFKKETPIEALATALATILDPPALNSWKDSSSVILLSEYLKQCKQYGIQLYASDRCPALHFSPGLTAADVKGKTERGRASYNALDLLLAAAMDLRYLMAEGLIDLPQLEVM